LEDPVRFDTLSVITLSLVSFPGIEASGISGMVTSAKLSQTQKAINVQSHGALKSRYFGNLSEIRRD
jgi:hypothetical protein